MPRLSIIVPHLVDDAGLEVTLLSIFENRESDLEVLIAHDGSYSDPYDLGQDEAVLIESASGASVSSQVNLAVASACSPYIQVLMPGTTVDSGWFNESIDLLDGQDLDAVCVPISNTQSSGDFAGLSTESLPHRRIASTRNSEVLPMMCGGVFRKRVFHALGGWLDHASREVAEVEMALLFDTIGLEVGVANQVSLHATRRVACGQEPGYEIGRACGQLACAYASIEGSGIVLDSLARRLGHLASGLMSPKTVAERLGWVMGIKDRSLVNVVSKRLESAMESLSVGPATIALPEVRSGVAARRAA